jgi:hypothetical protein
MRKLLFVLYLLLQYFVVDAVNYSGIYTYSKGMNKASGTIYLSHFNEDSVFFILQSVSGMPDFNTTEIKGFFTLENGSGSYFAKDSGIIQFDFNKNACILQENEYCKYNFSTNGKYIRTSTKLKKGNSLLPAFADKNGIVKTDSIYCFSVPNIGGITQTLVRKNQKIQITDEYDGFYMIEIQNKKNEFLWLSKKNIQLIKNK